MWSEISSPPNLPFTNWSEVFSPNHQLSGNLCRASIDCHTSDACVARKEEERLPLASLLRPSCFRMALMLLCLLQLAAPLSSPSVPVRFYLFWLNTPWRWLLTDHIHWHIYVSTSIHICGFLFILILWLGKI